MASQTSCLLLLLVVGFCSADRCMFLRNRQGESSSPSRFSVLHAPAYVNFVETSAPLPAGEVGAVSAFALGLAPGKTLTWDGLSPGSLFHRPKANVLFLVDGVGAGDHVSATPLRSSPLVVDTQSLTGKAVHVVSGNRNLASHVSDLFHGTPLTLSMSSSKDVAVSAAAGGKNSVTMFYDHASRQVQTLPASSPFAMTSDQLVSNVAALQLPSGLTFSKDKLAIMSEGKPVLAMSNKESASFLAELSSLHKVLSVLSADPQLVNDNIPDVLTFSISSLKDLHVQFGSSSAQVKVAMELLSAVLPQVAESLSLLYKSDAIVELMEVGFNGALYKTSSGDIPALYDALKEHVQAKTVSSFCADLPHITLHSKASYEVACQDGANKLAALSSAFQIECDQPLDGEMHSGRELLYFEDENVTYARNASTFNLAFERTDNWTAAFTMFLIVFLIFTLSTLAVSYTMWTMDPGSDSIIYRMTNQRIKND